VRAKKIPPRIRKLTDDFELTPAQTVDHPDYAH
jgi:hypothetical protein